jgi:Tfp pilus assembly protein PilO
MKNLPKEKRDRLILIVLGTLMVLIAIWYGLVSAQNKSLAAIHKRTLEQQDKVGSAKRLINSVGDLEKSLEVATEKLRSIEHSMASGDMYSWIILTMNRFRADRNVDIPQFSREVTVDVGVLPKFPYRGALFNVRGSAYFHDLGKFIADFENEFPYLRLQNLELEPAASSSATSTGDAEKLAFKMEIVTLVNPNVP